MTPARGKLAAQVVAAGAVLAMVVGCGGQAMDPAAGDRDRGRASATPSPHADPVPRNQAVGAAREGVPASPSLPPGDPGLDAPAVPDPGTARVEPHGEEEHHRVRRTVPTQAMLTADDVSMMTGARWEQRDGGGDACVRPEQAVATRSRQFGGAQRGVVVETVATYPDVERADAAVERLVGTTQQCGWSSVQDPRLGSASVEAAADGRVLTAVSAEGVVVLLVGSGPVTEGWTWDGLVDLALGSSCPAAPDGCH